MPQDRAKRHIRKLRTLRILYSTLTILYAVVLIALLFTDRLTVTRYLLCFLIPYLPWKLLWMAIDARVRKKYLYDVLFEELNAPLFLEIMRYVSRDDPFALGQLYELHAKGLHADVVSLCAKQLANPYAKRYRLTYLTYMEEAYFKLGDDQRLRKLHETAERELAALTNAEKVRKKLPVHGFHAAYLSRDPDACEAYFAATPPMNRFSEVNRLLLRARVAQLRGDRAEARRLLGDVLTEAPDTPHAVTARAHLEALERGEGYESAYPQALPDPLFPVVTTEKRHRVYKILFRVILAFLAVLLVAYFLLGKREQAEYEALCEDVRVAMEAEYDGVTVFECFTVSDGESRAETLALCSTDRGLVLASPYYQGDSEVLQCWPVAVFLKDDFAESPLPSRRFSGYTADYYGICAFYASEEEIPEGCCVSFPVTVYGQELWFAVTDVAPAR